MTDTADEGSERVSAAVPALILQAVDGFIADADAAQAALDTGAVALPADVLAKVEAVEGKKSYRDGLMIQLAFGIVTADKLDHTQRATGGRWAAGALGKGFAERHIPAVHDAYQNIGKNSPNLARGNEPAFDDLLHWMNDNAVAERKALFHYIAARVAATARPVLAMPTLRPAALTFANVARVLDELLATPSGGAHEQFAVAAFLDAILHEQGVGGFAGGLRVETKNINASDASAGTAADVQIMRANRIEEVFEVSANNWRDKVAQAVAAAVGADQPRAHIIAVAEGDDRDLAALDNLQREVTVTDVRSFLRVLVAVLRRPHREVALRRFYELMDSRQPNTELTNGYVRLLGRLGLTDADPADVVGDGEA